MTLHAYKVEQLYAQWVVDVWVGGIGVLDQVTMLGVVLHNLLFYVKCVALTYYIQMNYAREFQFNVKVIHCIKVRISLQIYGNMHE